MLFRSTLTRVVFPPKSSEWPSEWLGWSADQWRLRRDGWFDELSAQLDVEVYLRRFFHADERLANAEKDVLRLSQRDQALLRGSSDGSPCVDGGAAGLGRLQSQGEGRENSAPFVTLAAAEAWLRRVEAWRQNLREALRADSVPAPGEPATHWLLQIGRAHV